ncbi:TM2 domain-containing protein [Maribacter polysaccharolyticus]|uniref:TM2 domain-containing protein n=1 Tax=Maribacter polysaccharolyticus TaxID=3020831 RepID=UPI00237F096C|nr:TM2 domain-containing protein [Maribacter polysaccharolyticus]MDE3742454.1 TM2 domain-containing protein [Maribacter polysaccharolyticus]
MSEENKDLGDKAKDLGEKASEKFEDAKEATKEFADEAKETAKEFSDSAKEAFSGAGGENKKLLSGILAIVLGSLGIHKFILGYTKEGIIMLAVTIVLGFFTCGIGASLMGILGLIEGILYLTKSDEEFYNTYQVGKKPWF